ncbi:hypothetical protein GO730_19285 [Spirosoma sp. HMF3257]|uniref:Uncharacterized protein n=1 Tax=Spirosoma telluris TaxID=2183553 RepID=A0A327NK62_9BACT|nr:hypothetical protein [Spirosoma telluris]RAI75751.1 hypothetical protein HMF3257_19215 [Spirosoma telluris]
MNRIQELQNQLPRHGVDFLSETDCNRILADYATLCDTYVACPYKPEVLLTEARGRAGRTNVHVVGVGAVSYGDTPFDAKLNAIIGFLDRGYFKLDSDLRVIRLL